MARPSMRNFAIVCVMQETRSRAFGGMHMRWSLPLAALVLTGCVVHLDLEDDKPLQRAVHTGERATVGYFYALKPTCEAEMLPEITVLKSPLRGNISFEA